MPKKKNKEEPEKKLEPILKHPIPQESIPDDLKRELLNNLDNHYKRQDKISSAYQREIFNVVDDFIQQQETIFQQPDTPIKQIFFEVLLSDEKDMPIALLPNGLYAKHLHELQDVLRKYGENLREVVHQKEEKVKRETISIIEEESRKKKEEREKLESEIQQKEEEIRKLKEEKEDAIKKQKEEAAAKQKKRDEKLLNIKGFLSKKGHRRTNWNTRFFIVNREDNTICYYNDNSLKKLKGRFVVQDCQVQTEDDYPNHENVFSVKLSKEHNIKKHDYYLFSAATEKERKNWMEAFELLAKKPAPEYPSEEKKDKPIAHDGYLEKEGHVRAINPNPSWKKRYFRLQASDPIEKIEYFTEVDGEKKGEILLRQCSIEKMDTYKKREFCFSLKTPRKNYVLSAQSSDERDAWITHLSNAIEKLSDDIQTHFFHSV